MAFQDFPDSTNFYLDVPTPKLCPESGLVQGGGGGGGEKEMS